MAKQLVESMTVECQPRQYRDEYREALMNWIERKARGGKKATRKAASDQAADTGGAEIIDMMELLKKSMKKGTTKSGGQSKAKGQTRTKATRKSSAGRRKRSSG